MKDLIWMSALWQLSADSGVAQHCYDRSWTLHLQSLTSAPGSLMCWRHYVVQVPFRLTPTALFSSMMITSGTMTHRLQSLENRALIKRLPNPADARSMLVQLSASGLKLIDRAVAAHVENERRILAPLKASSQAALNASDGIACSAGGT
jgi:hypothetical protein